MRIPAFTAAKDFGKFTAVTKIETPQEWPERLDKLARQVDAMQRNMTALRRTVVTNRRAIRRLLDVYTQHSPLFEVAGIYSIYDLSRLSGQARRSALAKMNKSEYWPQDQTKQLTSEEFKEICEAAKTVTEDDDT